MSKDIIIKESGVAKSLNGVDRITTKLVNGSSANWIPEDETELAEISVTSNGQYVASGFGYYGFVKVNVNVAGGSGSEVLPAIDGIDQINAGTIDLDNVYVEPHAGSIGSTIMGIDPTTGEWTTMTIDGNGNLVQEKAKLPKSIKVLTPPAKTTYTEGEKINYSRLTVELLDEDGNTFTSADFPTGVLTWGAPYYFNGDTSKNYGIITEVDKVPDVGSQYSIMGATLYDAASIQRIPGYPYDGRVTVSGNQYPVYGLIGYPRTGTTDTVDCLLVSKGYFYSYITYGSGSGGGTSSTQINNELHIRVSYMGSYSTGTYSIPPINYTKFEEIVSSLRGSSEPFSPIEDTKIPVKWLSPYDNTTYSDSFGIRILKKQSAASDDGFEGSGGGKF